MAFFQRRRQWPYAVNSTGRFRGTLNLGLSVGRVQVYEAIGPARAIYMDRLGPEVVAYLNNNRPQDSGNFVDLSLFMMGKSALRMKPMLMFVSDDKFARRDAFNLIKQSGLMAAYPGFDLGHMDLRAEFENFQPMADTLSCRSAFTGQLQSMAPSAPRPATGFVSPVTLRKWLGEAPVPRQEQRHVCTDSCSTEEAADVTRLLYRSGDGDEPDIRSATAGGIVSYRGEYMYHSVNHFLQKVDSTLATHPSPESEAENIPDCEVTGLSDFEDEGDDEEILSRESATPRSRASRSSTVSQTDDEDTASVFSHESSPSVVEQSNFVASVTHRLQSLQLQDSPPLLLSQNSTIVADVLVSCSSHDFSLIKVGRKYVSINACSATVQIAIPLERYQEFIEDMPRDAAIKTTTAYNGVVAGTLSGSPSFVRLPGRTKFQEVYIGKLNRPLVRGDCGSWVRDAVSGKVYGHVIAGSPTTGLIMLVPARHSFAEALATLAATREASTPANAMSSCLASKATMGPNHTRVEILRSLPPPSTTRMEPTTAPAPSTDPLWCEFGVLGNCNATFPLNQTSEWVEHHYHHVKGQLPHQLACWFCDKALFATTSKHERYSNFLERMEHIREHIASDYEIRDCMRPDFFMINHLANEGLIDDAVRDTVLRCGEVPPALRMPGSYSHRQRRGAGPSFAYDLDRERRHQRPRGGRRSSPAKLTSSNSADTSRSLAPQSDTKSVSLTSATCETRTGANSFGAVLSADALHATAATLTDLPPETAQPQALDKHSSPMDEEASLNHHIVSEPPRQSQHTNSIYSTDGPVPQPQMKQRAPLASGADFNRKDVFIEHLRRMHTIPEPRISSSELRSVMLKVKERLARGRRRGFAPDRSAGSDMKLSEAPWARHELASCSNPIELDTSLSPDPEAAGLQGDDRNSSPPWVSTWDAADWAGGDWRLKNSFDSDADYFGTDRETELLLSTVPERPSRDKISEFWKGLVPVVDGLKRTYGSVDKGSLGAHADLAPANVILSFGDSDVENRPVTEQEDDRLPQRQPNDSRAQSSSLQKGLSSGHSRHFHTLFHCDHADCNRGFNRAADLERHIKHVHNKDPSNRVCVDYKRCLRDKGGFHRADHFRDHLRGPHQGNSLRPSQSNEVATSALAHWMEDDLLKRFSDRDRIFVLDNSSLGVDCWAAAADCLSQLIQATQGLDNDGLDVHFTTAAGKGGHSYRMRRDRLSPFPSVGPGSPSHTHDFISSVLDTFQALRSLRRSLPDDGRSARRVRANLDTILVDAEVLDRKSEGLHSHLEELGIPQRDQQHLYDIWIFGSVLAQAVLWTAHSWPHHQLLGSFGSESVSAAELYRAILKVVEIWNEHGRGSRVLRFAVPAYTGDILNLGMAVVKARAAGLKVELFSAPKDSSVGK